MKRYIVTICCLIAYLNLYSDTTHDSYKNAYNKICKMLSDKEKYSFKDAVFIIENTYLSGSLKEKTYNDLILFYSSLCRGIMVSGDIEYTEKDKDETLAQCAVFILMTEPVTVPFPFGEKAIYHMPFNYNTEDYAGQKDWSNMFVSKLMETNIGNCHSLPYLYKMIMDELGYECHLALAPNHMYIKAYNKKVGWYNIELTCDDFPTDAWYAASGYIHTDAIRNGIYMRALSDKEAVAMTLVDLAQGYQAKFGIEDGSFIIKCCDTSLEHFSKNINAMLLKAEILTELYRESKNQKLLEQMTELYTTIHELGYRKMPQQMYANWLNSLNAEDRNQGVKAILNPRSK